MQFIGVPSVGGQPPPPPPPEPPAPREISRAELVAWRSATGVAGLVAQGVFWTYAFLAVGPSSATQDPRLEGLYQAMVVVVVSLWTGSAVWASSMLPFTPRKARVILSIFGGGFLVVPAILGIVWSIFWTKVVSS